MKAESGQNNNSRADMGAVAPGTTSAQRSSAGLPNLQSRWNLSLSSLGLHPASPANSPGQNVRTMGDWSNKNGAELSDS